jgi:aryl-alcohol dehydrogenase-like predicted oxidoreductase
VEYGRVPGIDKPVSRFVQGTVMLREDDVPASFALLDAVFERGCTALDTARHYGRGNEVVVGRWLRERGLTDRIFLIGKGAHHTPERNRVTPEDIAADLAESLERLGVEAIDLYLLHRDDPAVPVGPIVEALDGHRRAGRIRAYGGSNWTAARIAEANAHAAAHDLAPFVASSPQFSLAEQVDEPWAGCVSISGPAGAADRAWYAAQGMPIFAWSSLAGGFLSGALDRDDDGGIPAEPAARARRAYGSEANWERLARARALAAERDATVPQVALAWAFAQPLNLFAIVGSESGEEFAANAAALALPLSAAECDWLDLRRDDR